MQSLLWKFTVLAGVIVSSCAVVYQAHKSLSHGKAETAESFDPLVQPAASLLPDAPLAFSAAENQPVPVGGAESAPAPLHSLAAASFPGSLKKDVVVPAASQVIVKPAATQPEPTPTLVEPTLDSLEPTLAGPGAFTAGEEESSNSVSPAPGLPAWATPEGSVSAVESTAPRRAPLPLNLEETTPATDSEALPVSLSPLLTETAPTPVEPLGSAAEEVLPEASLAPVQAEAPPAQEESASPALWPGLNAPTASDVSTTPSAETTEIDPFFNAPAQDEAPAHADEVQPLLSTAATPAAQIEPEESVAPTGLVRLPSSAITADLPARTQQSASLQDDEHEYVIRQRSSNSQIRPAAGTANDISSPWPTTPAPLTVPRELAQVDASPVPGQTAAASAEGYQDPFGAGQFSFDNAPALPQPAPAERAPIQFDLDESFPARNDTPQPAPEQDDLMPTVIPGPSSAPVAPQKEPEVPAAAPLFPMESFPARATESTIPKSAEPASWPTFESQSVEPVQGTPSQNMVTPASASPTIPSEAISSAMMGTGVFDPSVPSDPQRPEIQIEKQAPAEASLNDDIIYSIIVRNVGKNTAHNVIVEDRIPKGTELVGTSPVAYDANGKLMWKFETLKPGEEQKLLLKVIAREPGEIGSVATVSFSSSVGAKIKVTAPQLSIKMHGPAEAIVGQKISYRFHIQNSGEGDARSVWLRTILPAGLRHPGGDDIEYEIGIIPAGESRDIDLEVSATEAGAAVPQAMLTIDGKTQSESTSPIRIIGSRLRIARTGPVRRFVGRPASFNTAVVNDSSQPLSNIKIVETLPKGVDLASMPVGGSYDATRRIISWVIPQLAPGAKFELQAQMIAKEAGEHAGKLVAMDDSGNTAEVTTELHVKGFADLDVDVQQYPRQPVAVGEQVSLKMVVSNEGSAAATNVQAAFEIPAEFGFVNARAAAPYKQVGQIVTFELGSMAKGEKQELDLVLLAAPTAQEGNVKVKAHVMSAESESSLLTEEEIHLFREAQ